MSSYYNQGVQVIIGNGQNFPGTPRISLIPFIQNAYDKGLLNFTVLPPGSISLAEIQDISTAKILGRSTAGSGVIEQISIGTGLSLSGGILSSTATATPGGSDTQIQYNNAGAFAGSSQLIANIGTTNTLDITGSGSTSATNALRVRNSAGTNLLTARNDGYLGIGTNTPLSTLDILGGNTVDGLRVHLTGQVPYIAQFYNDAYSSTTSVFQYFAFNSGNFAMGSPSNKAVSIYTSASGAGYSAPEISLTGDGNLKLLSGTGKLGVNINPTAWVHVGNATTASTPSMLLSGSGYSGGTSTTTKPTLLIEPTGTTSTGWSTSGTKLGVNAESGFTGNLLDLQVNGVSQVSLSSTGFLYASGARFTGAIRTTYINNYDNSLTAFTIANTTGNTIFGGGLFQFGGTTSSFPAIKRNGTGLDIRLADDSGYGILGTGTLNNFANTTASTPSMLLSGTGFSGGTTTTTKPTLLIEPTGTTSTGWSTSGTKFGVNAESGFTGRLLELQVNGVSQANFSANGNLRLETGSLTTVIGNIYAGGEIYSGTYLGVTNRFSINSPSDGIITLRNYAATDLNRVNFGGTTASYPALKRNSTGLDVRLADDSGYAPLIANDITTMGRFIGTSWRTSASYEFYQPTSLTGSTSAYYFGSNTLSGTNTNQKFWDITSTINKTGTGSYSIIDLDVTQTSAPSGTNYLMNLKVGGDSKLSITNDGAFTVKGRTTSGWASTYKLGTNSTDASINGYANNTLQIIDQSNSTQENKPNALLNVSSTNKGFLPPRLTTAQRDAVSWVAGDAGMIIFNTTTSKHQGWDGSVWNDLY